MAARYIYYQQQMNSSDKSKTPKQGWKDNRKLKPCLVTGLNRLRENTYLDLSLLFKSMDSTIDQ
jgi:hypothetical protein